MKKLFTLVIASLCLVVLSQAPWVSAKEVLKVTQDHFEFRDAPKVDDETFIGTLRIDTPVEWTGNVSGAWFEVKAPNGQIGWMHKSGLSRPKSSVVQPKRTDSAPATSRSASQPSSSAQVSKLKASVKELEKAQEHYEVQLKEKDRRIQELSEELGQVEEKLSDTGQMLDDQEQLRTLNERKVTEAEKQLLALEETIKEKDEALLTAKVEMTKIENQLQNLRNQQGAPLSADRILLILSLVVNVLGFLFFLTMRKRLAAAKGAAPSPVAEEGEEPYQEPLEAELPEQEDFDGTEAEAALELEDESSAEQRENDDRMKELDVVMAAPYPEDDTDDSADEVEIDLGDVLPAAAGAAAAAGLVVSLSGDDSDDSEPADAAPAIVPDAEVIVVEEAIEGIEEELPEEILPEAESEELIPDEDSGREDAIDETLANFAEEVPELTEEPEVLETLDEGDAVLGEVDELEEVIELPEEPEELIELEETEESLEFPDDELEGETLEEVEELLLEDEQEFTSGPPADENEFPEAAVTAIEVSGEHFEKLPQSSTQLIESDSEDESSFDEIMEEPLEDLSAEAEDELLNAEGAEENGENDNEMIIGTPGIIDEDDYENEPPDFESSEEVEIGGFEVETEERWDNDSVDAMEELSDADDDLREELSETEATIAESPEPEERVEESGDEDMPLIELPDDEETDDEGAYKFDEASTEVKEFEVEEIVVIDELDQDQGVSKALHDEREEFSLKEEALDISSEVEELLELDEAGPVIEPKSAPSFLEPSPYLIEPEHEPEENLISEEEVIEEALGDAEQEEEGGYAIELLDAGSNAESVVHVLSKVNGLLASPNELVERTPCLIAKGAGKSDAEGFQIIMQKLGATVRLHPQD